MPTGRRSHRPDAFASNAIRSASCTSPPTPYYGVQTARAVENFPISGLRAPADLVTATILIKKAAAERQRGARPARPRRSPTPSSQAADEILAGALRDQFVVDVYQAGAGTSHNMNANEVLANRAAEILGEPRGDYTRVHPNDHVNMGQSTNDVFPTATRLALLLDAAGPAGRSGARARRRPRARRAGEFARRAEDRPHAPAGRRADHARPGVRRLRGQRRARGATRSSAASEQLRELNLGATAVGTGLNAGDDYTRAGDREPRRATPALPLRPAAESVPRHAEHGRRARLLGRAAAAGGRSRQGRVATCGCSAWARAPGIAEIAAAGRAAGLVDHAGQGEPVGPRDGQPGLLPGDRLRRRRSSRRPKPGSSS